MKRKINYLLIFIILLAIVLRTYKMNDLAVFLADQASDSTKVLNMMRGKLTLLGPISSVGGFFNGPIVYYLMLPFYFMMNGDPLAGTVFQTVLQILTIPLIYFIGKKISSQTVGLVSSFVFAISPLMIDYSRAGFNAHPAIFFSTLIIWLLIELFNNHSMIKIGVLGLLLGFIIQMHYLTITLILLAIVYPIIINKKTLNIKYYLWLFGGLIIGLSPFLIFELRHNFLNINLMINYFLSNKESIRSITNILVIWPDMFSQLMFGNDILVGLIWMMITLSVSIYLYLTNHSLRKYLKLFFVLISIVFMIGLLYGSKIQPHYIISIHTSLIILFALVINYLLKGRLLYLIIFCSLLLILNISQLNLDKRVHPGQDGLNIRDYKKAAEIIKNNNQVKDFNVAMHVGNDNRAMPLRYLLTLNNIEPMSYEDYGNAQVLYFLIKKKELIKKQTMWEYTSFGSSLVEKTWEINKQYNLVKLAKNKNND